MENDRKIYYRELILDLIPLSDSLEANGASRKVIESFDNWLQLVKSDYKAQFEEEAWWD